MVADTFPLLHTISSFSLMRGVNAPEGMVAAAKSAGYSAVCIADRNNLYALPRVLAAGKKHDIRIIIGTELVLDNSSLLLFADGDVGYHNLCATISRCIAAPVPSVATLLQGPLTGVIAVSDDKTDHLRLSGKCRLYYRLSRPRRLPEWARKNGCSALVTAPAAFLKRDDFATHRLLSAIALNTTLSQLDSSELLPDDAFVPPVAALKERFEVFDKALEETVSFAALLTPCTTLQALKMPRIKGEQRSAWRLREKTLQGAKKRYGSLNDRVLERIDYELELIESKGFPDYFLIVDDIVKQSPRTCGRGSGAASIVAYSLGITNVDPLRYNLLFDRFLNPGRTDPPDIDVDFAWDERDSVLDYVFKKYGRDHAAMVATHQTCGARMAIREVARVYGMTEQEISTVTKKIPWFLDISEYGGQLEATLMQWPGFQKTEFDTAWKHILKDAGSVIGLPRGVGTHCGGVVITDDPICSHVPVQRSAKGYPVIQWEKDGAEEMGLVKIDLLGNRSLAVIRDAITSIKRAGVLFDESAWRPQDDPATQQLVAEGRTMGVFYVESPAMRLLQRKSNVGDFDHLVIHSSIIRPAANKFIQLYLERLHGKSWQPLHPLLNDVLDETFGIMVYQEDVSRVAIALAGFSSADADRLRKIVSKKSRGETFTAWKERFFSGSRSKGVRDEITLQVWDMMLSFSGYSFCKPHSASYVQVSFQSAYLKAHYPSFFMAAVLSNYGGFYTTQAYVSEVMRLGISIIPPGVNSSTVHFRATTTAIHVGLCQIKGLSHSVQQYLVQERIRGGRYTSIVSLLQRTGMGERDAEVLILAGACDEIDSRESRPQQFWAMRAWCRSGTVTETPVLGSLSREQYLLHQYEMLGFLPECHPITLAGKECGRPALRARNVDRHVGKRVELFGWCVTSKTVTAKTGESMEFVTFEDETGIFETVFFPQVYRQFSLLISWQMAFRLTGKVTQEFGVAIVEVDSIVRVS